MEGEVEIIGLGGAIGDVAESDTAFSNRGYLLWLNFAMRWDDPADDADYIGRTRMIVAALAPWIGRGVYVNMLNFDEQDRVVEAFGGPEKYAGLARLKAQYDPAEPLPHEPQHPASPLNHSHTISAWLAATFLACREMPIPRRRATWRRRGPRSRAASARSCATS